MKRAITATPRVARAGSIGDRGIFALDLRQAVGIRTKGIGDDALRSGEST